MFVAMSSRCAHDPRGVECLVIRNEVKHLKTDQIIRFFVASLLRMTVIITFRQPRVPL